MHLPIPTASLIPLLFVVMACVTAFAVRGCNDARGQERLAVANVATQRALNDSTEARLASSKLQRQELEGLLTAARALGGKLIAGVVIHIPARDTSVAHPSLPTTLAVDSTRTASFRDSSFAGVLSGVVTAPPCCVPLGVRYQLQRPAFSPSVGFVQVGDRQVAVVTWQGEHVELPTPYSVITNPPHRLVPYVEALADPGAMTVSAGVQVRAFLGLSAVAAASQRLQLGEPLRAGIGVRKDF